MNNPIEAILIVQDLVRNATVRSRWVEWSAWSDWNIEKHGGTALKDFYTNTTANCVALNEIWLRNERRTRRPLCPIHINCRCRLREIPTPVANQIDLIFDMTKITNYAFREESHPSGGKLGLFSGMGYTVDDAQEVYDEIARQGKEQYAAGNYTLGLNNNHGQQIKLPVIFVGKREVKGRIFNFETGWIIYPKGKIKLATPMVGRRR